MEGDLMSLQTEPFEQAGLSSSARDQRAQQLPAFEMVMNITNLNSVTVAVFANQPNQDF